MSSSALPPSLQRAGRITAWVVGALLIVASLMALWIGVRGALAYTHLSTMRTMVPAAVSAAASNPADAAPQLEQLASEARAADDLTSDAIWSLGERSPWLGPQLAAFRTIAASSNQMLGGSLVPLAVAAQGLSADALKPRDGRLDAAVLTVLSEPAESAAATSRQAAAAVQNVNRTPLVGVVGSAVEEADALFTRTASAIDALSRSTQLLPAMLGQDGPRSYLILVQNNAEWRSLGGIAGTAILLRVDQGSITIADTRSATALSRGITDPIVDLPQDVQDIYDTRPARYFHNLTQVPDFSFDGPLAREMYERQTGQNVDGVIAMDPVVLSYLLKATGPVPLPDDESLTAENAVPLLLSDVYARYSDPAAQDAFFAGATGAVFQAFLEGQGSASGLLTGIARGVDERRIMLWSARDEEQRVIDGTALAGQLPLTDDHTARFGVYLNDGTGSKMSYYVKPVVSLAWGTCGTGTQAQERQLTLTMTLTNTAPPDAATALPPYITGNGAYATAPGSATVVSNLYLPQGWTLSSVTTSAGNGYKEATLEGRQVVSVGANLAPQETGSVTVTVETTTTASEAEAIVTPTADASLSPLVRASCAPVTGATLE